MASNKIIKLFYKTINICKNIIPINQNFHLTAEFFL